MVLGHAVRNAIFNLFRLMHIPLAEHIGGDYVSFLFFCMPLSDTR